MNGMYAIYPLIWFVVKLEGRKQPFIHLDYPLFDKFFRIEGFSNSWFDSYYPHILKKKNTEGMFLCIFSYESTLYCCFIQ